MKNLIRNCERLFPPNIDKANVKRARKRFYALKRDNEKKRIAAKLELKLRSIYFDVIDPASVEGTIKSIYEVIESLDDIMFLLKYAKLIFPPSPNDIEPLAILESSIALRERLSRERNDAVENVQKALRVMYAHEDPERVDALGEAASAPFSKVVDLKKLAADCQKYFPGDFERVADNPSGIYDHFQNVNA